LEPVVKDERGISSKKRGNLSLFRAQGAKCAESEGGGAIEIRVPSESMEGWQNTLFYDIISMVSRGFAI